MKLIVLAAVMLFALGTDHGIASAIPAVEDLVFEGTVLKIGRPVPMSGRSSFYRLAKYRIERICRGQYTKSEIVVDHLSMGDELGGIKVGDRVCVAVSPSKKISPRFNEKGIREESESVKVFYLGDRVPPPGSPCECKVN